MATNKIHFPRTDSYIAYVQEATFGTAIADDQNYTILDIADGSTPSFEESRFLDEEKRNDETNVLHEDDFFQTSLGMWQRYTIPPFIARAQDAAHFIYAAFQNVSEAVGDPYTKTYTIDGTVKPDFSSNAGYFGTLLIKSPMASFSQKLTSFVMENLEITFDFAAHGGRATVAGTALTGRGWTGTSNPNTGTIAHNAGTVLTAHDTVGHTLQLNSTDMTWYMAKIRIENTFDYIGYTSATGFAENYGLVRQDVFFDCTVKYDANSDTFLNLQGQDIGAVNFDIGSAGVADPALSFDSPVLIAQSVTIDRGGTDSHQKMNISGQCRMTDASDIVLVLADGADQAW